MKYFIITKKQALWTLSTLVAVIAATAFSISVFAGQSRKLPIYNVKNEDKKIAISFDAAWGNDDTGNLIDILAKYKVKATFFVVGGWVDKYPESVKQLADAGHQIQNHSNTHPHMPKLSGEKMIEELKTCNEKIARISGQTPTLFRCPYGDYNNATVEAVESLDMYTIQWDVDSRDWMEGHTADRITNDVVANVKDGSIVLFHNDAKHTPEALPGILEQLSAK
ncbi:MAG: polysaccharide deacetylase family protein, partial [Oscillospiraceae bacterium]